VKRCSELDAHLIAAAPDLLAAAKEALAWMRANLRDSDTSGLADRQALEAAIAKAEGKS